MISENDFKSIVNDLGKLLSTWIEKWQMRFNVKRCKVMHFGDKNESRMSAKVVLYEVQEEKFLYVSNNLKYIKESVAAANKGNIMLGVIARYFHHR